MGGLTAPAVVVVAYTLVASKLDRDVEGDAGLPRRLLFVGLPLTIVAGALLAYLMSPQRRLGRGGAGRHHPGPH